MLLQRNWGPTSPLGFGAADSLSAPLQANQRVISFRISLLACRRTVRDQAQLDKEKGKVTGIHEWMVIDLLTSTGLRVSETANVRCGDLKIGYGQAEIFVQEGKGSISGTVEIPDSLKKHLN